MHGSSRAPWLPGNKRDLTNWTTLTYTPYRDVEQDQEVDRPVELSFELGFKGDEGKYRCLGLAGVQLADNQDTKITMAIVPDGVLRRPARACGALRKMEHVLLTATVG